jgi:hypothetical protein
MHYTNELGRMVSAQKIFPRRIWEGLQRAIALLSGCVAWFQRQYDSAHHTDAESVCRFLHAPIESQRHLRKIEQTIKTFPMEEGGRTSPQTWIKSRLITSSWNMQYEPVDSQNEPDLLANFCLFQDFQELRTTVKTAWTRYKDMEVDLTSTAAMTQAAFELIKSFVAHLSMEEIPGSDSMEELVLHLSCHFLAKPILHLITQ